MRAPIRLDDFGQAGRRLVRFSRAGANHCAPPSRTSPRTFLLDVPHTMLSSSTVPHTMLSPSPSVIVPHTMLSDSESAVPQTMLSPSTMPMLVPHTMLGPHDASAVPHTMLSPSVTTPAHTTST